MSKKEYTKQPQKKNKKRGKKSKGKMIVLIIIIVLCAIFLGGLGLLSAKYGINPKTIMQYKKEAAQLVAASTAETFRPNKASFIYSDDEEVIAKLYQDEESTYLTFDQIPKDVINAFVAVEDRTFWENSGIDTKGILRVVLTYIKSGGETAHGASTITQQVARDIFLTNEKSIERKVKEIFIAQEMTKKYDKKQIIEFYCNNCCFANAIYGIEDASRTYLGKPASQLSLSEAAYLCSIPNRPEYYDPFDNPDNAIKRRDKILGDMVECEFISQSECDAAKAEEIIIVPSEESKDEFHNFATTLATRYATEYLMEYKYDFHFQYEFDSDEDYDAYQENYKTVYNEAYHNLKTGGYQVYTSINLDAMDELQAILDDALSWNTSLQENGAYNLQGAITVVDNETGKVVAGIGGRTQEGITNTYSLNRAFQAYRQPGSSIKPLIVYAPALDEGYNANSMLINVDQDAAKNQSAEKIKQMEGDEMTLRYAVEHSKNGPVYWLASQIGIRKGIGYLYDMNFSRIVPSDYNLSAALGGITNGVSTAEMAGAYRTLANHGSYDKTDCILSILNGDGEEIYKQADSKQVYDDDTADQMIDILKGVITRGTAKKIHWYDSTKTEAAGKTGTTNSSRDGWFCGSTPYYTIAVWVGSDDNSPVNGLSGGNHPANIWKKSMLSMIDGLPAASFDLDVSQDLRYENSSEDASGVIPEEELQENLPEGTPPEGTLPEETTPGTTTPDTTPPSTPTPDASAPGTTNPDTPTPDTDSDTTPGTTIDGNVPSSGTNIDGSINSQTVDSSLTP